MIEYDVQYRISGREIWHDATTCFKDIENAKASLKSFRDNYKRRDFRLIKRTEEVVG